MQTDQLCFPLILMPFYWHVAVWMIKKIDDIMLIGFRYDQRVAVWMIKKIDDIS